MRELQHWIELCQQLAQTVLKDAPPEDVEAAAAIAVRIGRLLDGENMNDIIRGNILALSSFFVEAGTEFFPTPYPGVQ